MGRTYAAILLAISQARKVHLRCRPLAVAYHDACAWGVAVQAQKEFSEKHGWQRFSVSAADVAIAVLTTSKQLPTRLPSLLKAWMDDSPFDSIVVTDGPPPKTVRGKPMDPRVVHVDCPAGVEGRGHNTPDTHMMLVEPSVLSQE